MVSYIANDFKVTKNMNLRINFCSTMYEYENKDIEQD